MGEEAEEKDKEEERKARGMEDGLEKRKRERKGRQ